MMPEEIQSIIKEGEELIPIRSAEEQQALGKFGLDPHGEIAAHFTKLATGLAFIKKTDPEWVRVFAQDGQHAVSRSIRREEFERPFPPFAARIQEVLAA